MERYRFWAFCLVTVFLGCGQSAEYDYGSYDEFVAETLVVSARLEYAFSNHFGVSAAPEFQIVRGYNLLSAKVGFYYSF